MLMERQLDHPGGGKRRAFPSCGILTGFLILILPYVTSPQRRTVFQVSHSVSASSAPYRLNDALNRNISDMESVLLLRRRKGIDGLEISRSAARRATDALRRHLAHGFDALLPERRRDLPFSLNVLGMGFDTAQMEKADLVHLHWIGGRTVDFTRLSHIRRPLVYTLHDMFACTAGCHCTMDCDRFRDECRGSCPQLGTPRLFRGLPAWLFSRKRRSFARIPSLTLVTPSLWLKREVEKGCMFPGRRIVQIYNPVDTDLFRPAEDREAIRAALGIPSGAFVIACGATGLFNPVKGGHFIPLVLEELYRRGHRNLHLLLFGNQEKNVEFPFPSTNAGFITDMNKLAGLYSAADIFLNPTLQDVLSNVALESMACKTPPSPSGRAEFRKWSWTAGRGWWLPRETWIKWQATANGSSGTESSCWPWRRKAANTPNKRFPTPSLPRGTPPCMKKRSGNTVAKGEKG